MDFQPEDEFDEQTLRAVRYFKNEHGDEAIEQAQAAIKYASEINDLATVDVFEKALRILQAEVEKQP
ncbi:MULTISPECIES: hypothetical protein [unclassified Aureimonas]|uniref:hypothetical protein n=1 Tax=unclassified Aureimonas TaxID=2615206 RepID=UPI0006FA6DF7|nr:MULTISPECIES: hypothetical protein [unclassified Aureimonas]KQT60361.1 hypothetical protein ASG62_06805 [Aureimonas sp. Leaf427]KQT79239.1 hypothetical protein ASG54_09405 [Aureimonas sp. Leaf460]